ncbi:4-hydroxy-3-methylbut-2-en-1-yl diphosphate synthase [Parabacteroides sp. 52]|uniref:4-hydroxy-3-methylbut-2-en-1-yl diphosphate synthase n=1 Tax=unclassified Parabacteroides TaxID=2649774 RepID=UPI0013D15FED|nr:MULTISPECIES: 4-hydroxy-3-methylbut-2-en-1-yl diphosphate synthase [unclassified Parabacteroides]MDH6534773.1 (E)-4-hydroxy-3-methylbut-2-enyl-diphosphate synthase [Parabacteroides sp. PM5-20]NDV55778.1 4-hydroxy-3-methylbut-2-en-1-yl diphosphate synthase [Parabacteroides sp. 52]
MDFFNYNRRKSSVVHIGDTPLGGDYPIRVQSMANVSTMDTEASVDQAIRMIEAGAEYVRFTAQGEREARNLGLIRKGLFAAGYVTPLVADIHFNPHAADIAAQEVEKVRINPGNYVDKVKTFHLQTYTEEEYIAEIEKIRDRFLPFLQLCKQQGTAIRIGVNHGSLSDRIMSRYGDTPEGMVASCMEFLRLCVEEDFADVVISIKASNTVVMVRTVRLLVQTMEAEKMYFPLHLGVTEAGDGEDGRIKSAVGIGALLSDGLGDTIRVSLSEEPEAEMPVARKLVDYIREREGHAPIEGTLSAGYNPLAPDRRRTRAVHRIGGGQTPVVISDRTNGSFEINPLTPPDFLYIGTEDPDNLPDHFQLIVDAHFWKERPNAYPAFIASEVEELKHYNTRYKFIRLTHQDLTERMIEIFRQDPSVVLILSANNRNGVGSQRAAIHKLITAGCNAPLILHRSYYETDVESIQLKAGADLGTLLLDGFGDGLMLHNEGGEAAVADSCLFGILQAARVRISKTEYISCPSCGRTLFNLQTTIARVKEATSHLKGLKIGIMGCIVNGPGEMADADYGYVGAGRGRISLYKGKICILKNIPEEEAVERLVELIKENGDWQH